MTIANIKLLLIVEFEPFMTLIYLENQPQEVYFQLNLVLNMPQLF